MTSYKTCAVSGCSSTTSKFPDKLFIHVPEGSYRQNKLLQSACRDPDLISDKSAIFFCEDHFHIPIDIENYIQYNVIGSALPGNLPSKVQCQTDIIKRKTSGPSQTRAAASQTQDQTKDGFVSPGVSQCDKDLVVQSETPQTSTTAPEISTNAFQDMVECNYSSSTESAVSDVDDPSTFTTYEEQGSYRRSTEHSATETSTSILHNRLTRKRELKLEEEVQSRANKQYTQASDVWDPKEEIMERHNCYTIIVNVYYYLKREYDSLKRQLGDLYDVRSFSNIVQRTAAATGVSMRTVARALNEHRINSTILADHNYDRGISRTNTTSKSRNADFSVRMYKEIGTHSHILKKKQENKQTNGKTVRTSKKRTIKRRVRSKPSHKEQLPSKNTKSKGSVQSHKRQPSNDPEQHDSENMGPPKRRSTRIRARSKRSDEQLPFPSPIRLRVDGVMEMEYKTEAADDECQQTLGDNPFESGSWSHDHCEQAQTTEEPDMLFETEPADDDCLQDFKPDPLELESNATALDLEEPLDSSDTAHLEVKFECLDEDMDMVKDYSVFDQTPLDIKPEPE